MLLLVLLMQTLKKPWSTTLASFPLCWPPTRLPYPWANQTWPSKCDRFSSTGSSRSISSSDSFPKPCLWPSGLLIRYWRANKFVGRSFSCLESQPCSLVAKSRRYRCLRYKISFILRIIPIRWKRWWIWRPKLWFFLISK